MHRCGWRRSSGAAVSVEGQSSAGRHISGCSQVGLGSNPMPITLPIGPESAQVAAVVARGTMPAGGDVR